MTQATLTLEQQAKVKATALPLPEVSAEGTAVIIGRFDAKGPVKATLRTIGTQEVILSRDGGTVYRLCGYCDGGLRVEYGHVLGGVCFYCGGGGVKVFAKTTEEAQRKVRSAQAAELRRQAKDVLEAPAREAAAAAALAEAREKAHGEALAEQARRDAEQAVRDAQRYAGVEGGKVTVTGTVKVNAHVESRYGSSRLVIIEGTGDDAGVTLKTFGTSAWHYDVEVGDDVEVTATVKSHEVYGGTKQTSVIRPKGKVLASA
jgi:hypothetical protein